MDRIAGDFLIVNNLFQKSIDYSKGFDLSRFQLYEVLRVINGVPLFLEEHVDRLKRSVRAFTSSEVKIETEIKRCVKKLIRANSRKEGNIKILCNPDTENPEIAAYFIPHQYPDKTEYKKGIKLITFQIDRPQPSIKQIEVSDSIREKIQKKLISENAYDALLINKEGNITEGSKSNFFAIKNGILYSAPEDEILEGITRKYIIKMAEKEGIQVINKRITRRKLGEFDAAFICGTSPKVLPVRKINDLRYSPENNIINLLQSQYNEFIDSYIRDRA